MKKTKLTKYVRIHHSRGYGDRPFRVLAEDKNHYTLNGNQGPFLIFKKHCTIDVRLTLDMLRNQQAADLGL